jgi:hypothetical protein
MPPCLLSQCCDTVFFSLCLKPLHLFDLLSPLAVFLFFQLPSLGSMVVFRLVLGQDFVEFLLLFGEQGFQ